jgi:hypothetical protein
MEKEKKRDALKKTGGAAEKVRLPRLLFKAFIRSERLQSYE